MRPVEEFKANLQRQHDSEEFAREHILHGGCHMINESQHYMLKRRIAENYNLESTTDIFVVGSAKLGFSIAPHKRYRPFRDTSDIDLAIVNHRLYEQVWHEVHRYKESGADWPKKLDFESYSSWGWIRPDKLPFSPTFKFAGDWWDFFRTLQRDRVAGQYKVAAALYHDLNFLVRYQSLAIEKCRAFEGISE